MPNPMGLSMRRTSHPLRRAAIVAVFLMPAFAAAQAPPKDSSVVVAPKSDRLDVNGCPADSERSTVGQGGELDTGGRSLSDRLARSGGVICPPAQVDPAIKAPTPPEGSMPVIPPPGSPGGDPSVQPK